MSGVESNGVTLPLVDSSILSCWEEMVKQGKECSLMLKHSKGNVTVKLQSTSKVSPLPQASLSASAEAKKGKKEEQEETAGETPCLPPTPGGGERTPSKSANAAASCCGIDISTKPEPWSN